MRNRRRCSHGVRQLPRIFKRKARAVQRLGRVVHAKIENGIDPWTAGALRLDDQYRRGLTPANIAALGLRSIEHREESIDQLTLGAAVRLRHRGPH